MATVSEVLDRAADLLGEWGWCQGGARKGDSFCALGAIWFAASGAPPVGVTLPYTGERSLYLAGRDAFGRVTGGNLGSWNDEPGRTKKQVVVKLREAAELSKQSEPMPARLDRSVSGCATSPETVVSGGG